MQHNWKDPLAMSELVDYVDPAAERASTGRLR
jgi:hypothetical protein